MTEKIKITDEMDGREIIEIGLGLIARGMVRMSEAGDKAEAASDGFTCASVIRDMAFDFVKLAEKEKGA